MSVHEVYESLQESYEDCRVNYITIQLGNGETIWRASMECNCGAYFDGTGDTAEDAMLRMRINYSAWHQEHYTAKKKKKG